MRQKGNLVRHVDVARVTAGQHVAERDTVLHRLHQRGTDGAGLAYHTDRPWARRTRERGRSERADDSQSVVHEADAVWSDNPHIGLACERDNPLLLRYPLRFAGLRITGGEDHHSADAALRAIGD